MPIPPSDERIKRFAAFRSNLARTVASAHLDSVRPLFSHQMGQEEPVAEGSCVLVNLDGQPLVLTAAHVLEAWNDNSQLLVAVGAELRPLTGIRLLEELPASPTLGEHLFDVAVAVPDERFLEGMPPTSFLSIDYVNSASYRLRDDLDFYCVLGFPAEGTRLDAERRHFCSEAFLLTTAEARIDGLAIGTLKPEVQLVLQLDQDALVADDLAVEKGPEMFGVSGGPVFAIGDCVSKTGPARLVALATDWWRGERAILAADIRLFAHLYRKAKSEGFSLQA